MQRELRSNHSRRRPLRWRHRLGLCYNIRRCPHLGLRHLLALLGHRHRFGLLLRMWQKDRTRVWLPCGLCTTVRTTHATVVSMVNRVTLVKEHGTGVMCRCSCRAAGQATSAQRVSTTSLRMTLVRGSHGCRMT